MTVTLNGLIEYLRGIDSRLQAMTDEVLGDKVRYGLQNLASQAQCFIRDEYIPLSQYIDGGLLKFTVSPSKEIINYYCVGLSTLVSNTVNDTSVYNNAITIVVGSDKKVYVEIINTAVASELALVIKYFYVPDILEEVTMEVEPEVWHFLKHSMQIVAWGGLKDYEKEQYHQKVLDQHLAQKTLVMPSDMPNVLKGGFL